jgi:murein L,D-transpeptidase YafK
MDGKTGNGIWLHAVPDKVPLTRGSRGCVVVRNNVIQDLTQYIRLGRTPIIIQDKEDLTAQNELKSASNELSTVIDAWKTAWEKKDLDAYIAKYGEEFEWNKMNRDKYREFKAGLNEKYKSIAVKISRPLIFAYKGRAIARFLQEYTSDQHSDFGEKVLYLRRGKNGYQIVGEIWSQESSQVAKQEIEAAASSSTASASRTSASLQ